MARISGDASSYSTSFTVDMAASRRRGRRWPSPPAERRRPLLDEGPDALARVLGLEADVLRERLEFQRVAERQHGAVAPRGDLLDERTLAALYLPLVHGLDVAAGAEALSRASDDDDPHVVSLGGARDRVVQVVAQRVAERIEALRAVQGE